MIPTSRLWGALLVLSAPALAAGFFPGVWTIVLTLDLLLLTLAVGDWWIARAARPYVLRSRPARFSVGVPNRVGLELTSSGQLPLQARILDVQPASFTAEPATVSCRLAPGRRLRLTYDTTPGRRGRFAFEALWVRVRGPLGLAWNEVVIPSQEEIAVHPDLRSASRLLLSGVALDRVNPGLRSLRRDGQGSEFARLRDYTQGDSVREVAWKATARRGRPVTRVLESERSQNVMICVEAGRTMAMHLDGLTRLDHAVNAALFLAFVALRNGDRVGLTLFADGVSTWLSPAAGREQYRRIVHALYDARAARSFVDYPGLFREVSVRLPNRALLCVFTDLLDADQLDGLTRPLGRLARRHVPLCLTARDEGLHAVLSEDVERPEDAYIQAAAAEALLEREALKARVAHQGLMLLDADAQGLGLAAVNRYLDIKARGTL